MKKKIENPTFQKATSKQIKEFQSKIGAVDVDETQAPVAFTCLDPGKKYELDITKHTFPYNKTSAQEYVNPKEGFVASLDLGAHNIIFFPTRLRNRPDLLEYFCKGVEIPETGDFEVPCMLMELKEGEGMMLKFVHFHPYVNLIFEIAGDCILKPEAQEKYQMKTIDKE